MWISASAGMTGRRDFARALAINNDWLKPRFRSFDLWRGIGAIVKFPIFSNFQFFMDSK